VSHFDLKSNSLGLLNYTKSINTIVWTLMTATNFTLDKPAEVHG